MNNKNEINILNVDYMSACQKFETVLIKRLRENNDVCLIYDYRTVYVYNDGGLYFHIFYSIIELMWWWNRDGSEPIKIIDGEEEFDKYLENFNDFEAEEIIYHYELDKLRWKK